MNERERHEALVPMGCMVSSKGRFRNCDGLGHEWITRGDGAYVCDDDSTRLIDHSCGLGALTIGHGWRWKEDLTPRCYPLPHRAELRLAERLHDWVPCAEMVRFMKTGTDATSAAIRIARVYTGRDIIVDAGNYHGCQDWSVSDEHEGVPQCVRDLTVRVPFNDMAVLSEHLLTNKVAALIMEPVSLVAPQPGYLSRVRELCSRTGTVLIFDEVITGIRMARGGAQEVYEVTPDLCAIGKGLANGYPISAVCGLRELMSCWARTHLSGTHFADPSCMEAALLTMKYLENRSFWRHQEHIGRAMLEGTTALIADCGISEHARAIGHPHWWVLQIPDAIHQTYAQQLMIEGGVLGSNGSHFVSLAHSEPIMTYTLDVYREAFQDLRTAIDAGTVADLLKCKPNRVTFRRN